MINTKRTMSAGVESTFSIHVGFGGNPVFVSVE